MNLILASGTDAAFMQAFFVIAREGLEAVLVLAAIIAYLRASNHARKLSVVYFGAGAAVLASLATAYLVQSVFAWQEAQLELLEGITMLAAAGVLLYVTYWLFDKSRPQRWQAFLHGKVDDALTRGSALALGLTAFLAVYREGFETVLFVQALFSSMPASGASIAAGLAVGLVVLAAVFFFVVRYSVRLPVRKFFLASGALLFLLALIFAGKGVHELQEAGAVPEHKLAGLQEIPDAGVFPNLEALGLQSAILAASVAVAVRRPAKIG